MISKSWNILLPRVMEKYLELSSNHIYWLSAPQLLTSSPQSHSGFFVGKIIVLFFCALFVILLITVIPKFSSHVHFVYLIYKRILKVSYVGVEIHVFFAITVGHHCILHLLLVFLVFPSIFTVSLWKHCIPKSPTRSPPPTKIVHLLTIFSSYFLLVNGCVFIYQTVPRVCLKSRSRFRWATQLLIVIRERWNLWIQILDSHPALSPFPSPSKLWNVLTAHIILTCSVSLCDYLLPLFIKRETASPLMYAVSYSQQPPLLLSNLYSLIISNSLAVRERSKGHYFLVP